MSVRFASWREIREAIWLDDRLPFSARRVGVSICDDMERECGPIDRWATSGDLMRLVECGWFRIMHGDLVVTVGLGEAIDALAAQPVAACLLPRINPEWQPGETIDTRGAP